MGVRIDPGPGLVMRQLLPSDYRQFRRNEYQRMWRWVVWGETPLTFDEALALRRTTDDEHWCLIYVERGPKGGWTGATFTQREHKMPPLRKTHTWYLGWVFIENAPSHKKVPKPKEIDAVSDFTLQRATIALHA